MAGGKGGSSTTEVKIPEYIEAAAKRNLNKAEDISQIGYTPYYGADVAAFSPMQEAAMRNTAGTASAFGLEAPSDAMAGMPQAQDFGGVRGYSSAPLYEQSVAQLQAQRPGQYDAIMGMFLDPITGQPGAAAQPPVDYTQPSGGGGLLGGMAGAAANVNRDRANRSTTSMNTPLSYAPGGVNTRDPSSRVNQAAARLTSPTRETGAVTSSVRPVARPSGANKKVICTALHELGLLPSDIYALDARFAIMMDRDDPYVGIGYRLWATPVAEYIKKDTVMAKAVRYAILPIVLPWAKEMAHVMKPKDYKSDLLGKLIMAVAHPICRFIGKAASRQTVEV